MLADMHCHSKRSDGGVTQYELVEIAKASNLDAIAITDHDIYTDTTTTKELSEKHNIIIIDGVEISAFDYKRNRLVHLLCYMCDEPSSLNSMLESIISAREKEVLRVLDIVTKLYPITLEMVKRRASDSPTIYKQHIMQTLLDLGYCDSIYGELNNYLFSSKTGIAKTSIVYPDVYDVMQEIKKAGGFSVLAHPAVYNSYHIIPELIRVGLQGIEVYYPRAKPTDKVELTQLAKNYGLLISGGTDFHGALTSKINPIGTCTIPEKELEKLFTLKKRDYKK